MRTPSTTSALIASVPSVEKSCTSSKRDVDGKASAGGHIAAAVEIPGPTPPTSPSLLGYTRPGTTAKSSTVRPFGGFGVRTNLSLPTLYVQPTVSFRTFGGVDAGLPCRPPSHPNS
eukprot:TRINITY_DN68952_c0_g1_i1.p1 TRINITY_DN68952_c0_g1~~TRINITY_DN68952_c0_g1_i1.p1  ORF type:complete len:116 (-),score=9.02 TRINITY_DN68952_c0_g1_i1:27-374(-)